MPKPFSFVLFALGAPALSLLAIAETPSQVSPAHTLERAVTLAGSTLSADVSTVSTLATTQTASGKNRKDKPAKKKPAPEKKEIVSIELPRCVVTNASVSAGKPKVEVTYTIGKTEYHLWVKDRFAAQRFYKSPERYIDRAKEIEKSLKASEAKK